MKKGIVRNTIIAFFIVIIFLVPVLYIIASSFKSSVELFSSDPSFFPKEWTITNYVEALARGNFLRFIWNSLFV